MKVKNQDIQVYTLEGQLVFLADQDNYEGVKPIAADGAGIGAYPIDAYNGIDVALAKDDVYSGVSEDGTGIISTECVNPENNQSLIPGFWTRDFAYQDEFERTFITDTDRFYDWTSDFTVMKRKIQGKDDGRGCISISDYFDLYGEWEKSVEAFNHAHGTDFPAPFDDVLLSSGMQVMADD